jgi:hypothetical protein
VALCACRGCLCPDLEWPGCTVGGRAGRGERDGRRVGRAGNGAAQPQRLCVFWVKKPTCCCARVPVVLQRPDDARSKPA